VPNRSCQTATCTLASPTVAAPKYPTFSPLLPTSTIPITMAALATKTQSQTIFTKLKQKPANKVCERLDGAQYTTNTASRYASTAAQRTQHGAPYLSVSTYVSTAPPTIVTWVSTSPSCDPPISTVRTRLRLRRGRTTGTHVDLGQYGNGTSYAS
jgi:hypothetical protein